MRKLALAAVTVAASFAGLVLGAGSAHAHPAYYTELAFSGGTLSCATCHGATATCDGCHAHGAHGSSAKSSINIVASTDKGTYAPGETVIVTVDGGYKGGWLRIDLFDEAGTRLASATRAQYPVTLTAPAPASGTVTWRAAWYGNQRDASGASFGSGTSATIQPGYFTPESQAGVPHGWQTVAVPAFTVQATAAPAIALDPASLAFGSVTVGETKTLSTTLRNTGSAALTVTSIARCSQTSGAITWAPAAPLTIAAGASTTLDVTFAPTTAGALANGACLSVSSDDPANPTVELALSGTASAAPTPAIALSPGSLAFGIVTVGASRTLGVQVQNTGSATLNVASITRCAGTPTEVTWTLSTPVAVAPGEGATLDVTYAPAADGSLPAGACLTVASNDPSAPAVDLGLTGTGSTTLVPAIALAPAAVDFGVVTVGISKTLSVNIENTGNGALTVSSVSLCAGTPAVLTWTPAAPPTIAGGSSATLDVTYAPTSADALPAGACLALASDDPANPTITLAVSGSSVAAPAEDGGGGCGCNSGAPGSGLLTAVLLLLVALHARKSGARRAGAHGGTETPGST